MKLQFSCEVYSRALFSCFLVISSVSIEKYRRKNACENIAKLMFFDKSAFQNFLSLTAVFIFLEVFNYIFEIFASECSNLCYAMNCKL